MSYFKESERLSRLAFKHYYKGNYWQWMKLQTRLYFLPLTILYKRIKD